MQSQNPLSVSNHLAEIISLVVNVEDKAVEDKLLQFEDTEQLIKLLENEEVFEEIDKDIYCLKTGQLVKTWDIEEVSNLVQSIGKVRAKQVIKIKSKNLVSPRWIFTDDKALEQLSDTDPMGYFVFAASAIVLPFSAAAQYFGTDLENQVIEDLTEVKSNGYFQASKLPLVDIIRLNELMRRFLSITQSQTAYKHWPKQPEQIGVITYSLKNLIAFEQSIKETLTNLIRAEVKRGRLKSNMSYQEVMDLKLHYHGYSNFRNQNKLKSMTETEQVAFLLKDFMPDDTPFQVGLKAGFEPTGVKMETHTGKLELQIQEPKEQSIKLSFAQVLKRRK